MFKILGSDALYIDIADTWKKRMLELAGDDEKSQKFKDILGKSDVTYLLNGTTEEHTFNIRVPDEVTPEDIQVMADVALDILKAVEFPPVEVNGVRQRYQVVITNWKEPEIIGMNKTEGYSSGEVFKPIIQGLDKPGRMNTSFNDGYL